MQCALCKKESSLVQSHIIPKLVYDRIRTHPQSRFRSLDNPSKPLQAGEIHRMLCHECEERFSGLERLFACQFLDPLMENGTIPITSSGWLENYQLTVAWRTLSDELFRLRSFDNAPTLTVLQAFEEDLRAYLLQIDWKSDYEETCFINRRYLLSSMLDNEEIAHLMKSVVFSYALFEAQTCHPMVISYYAGVIYLTVFNPDRARRIMLIGGTVLSEHALTTIVQDELFQQIQSMSIQYSEGMTDQLKERIREYQRSHQKQNQE